jgi:hypothetical protein
MRLQEDFGSESYRLRTASGSIKQRGDGITFQHCVGVE